MACGCNKNKNVSRTSNRSATGNITAAVRAQAVRTQQVRSQAVTPALPKNENGANAAKRRIQALRRDALLKAKGK